METTTARGEPLGEIGIVGGETIGGAMARIGRCQFDRVVEGLTGYPDWDGGIHEARKALKRLRALLRLVGRDLVEAGVLRAENGALRDLGRALAPLRDARVSIETLQATAPGRCSAVDSLLADRYEHERQQMDGDPVVVEALLREVGALRRRWAAAFPGTLPDRFEAAGEGIARTHRRARKRMARAARHSRDADFHDWRKAVKRLRYQIEMLLPLDPETLAPRTALLDDLGELLGSEHDLTTLIGLIEPAADCGEDRTALLDLLSTRRSEVRDICFRLGDKAIGLEPSALVESLRGVWETARPQARPVDL